MPPKAKFTKDEIIQMAFRITREEGLDKITARELGTRLGSSARPIFTVFENMDQIREAVMGCAKELYRQYVLRGLEEETAFRGVGMAYVSFAMDEPRLFRLLFMSARTELTGVEHILPQIDTSYEEILQSVQAPYDLSREAADIIYQHLWTYTHGIAVMCATGLCVYTAKQISDRMTEIFKALLMMEKSGGLNYDTD